jgi:hypothetical protein
VGWFQFLASVIDSLAWPAAIAAVIYLLRGPLRARLADLESIGGWGLKAEFGKRVHEAEEAAEQAELPPPEPTLATATTALSTEFWAEIQTAPRAAVIGAWLAVEDELTTLAADAGVDADERPGALVHELLRRGVIDARLANVIQDLKRARDVAAHVRPYTVDRDEVTNYVKLAGRVRSALRLARQSREAAAEGRTTYDLLVYHDLSDPTERSGGGVPSVGDRAEEWFGSIGKDRHVVAVGPGIHEGRVTVVLAHGDRPMPEVQALLDRQPAQ